MKKNFKKIISLVLTVLMLMGTVSALVPITVSATGTITVNGDEMPLPYTLEKYVDQVINGVTYRFDPLSSHTTSEATVNADGTITLKMSQGDLFWMPGVNIDDDSNLNMKVTRDSGTANMACGLAYNIDAGTNGVWAEDADSLNVMNIQTNYRTRIGKGTVAKMKNGDLADEFVARAYFDSNSNGSGTISAAAQEVYNGSKQWIQGAMLEMNLQKDGATVAASFRNGSGVEFVSRSYTVENEPSEPKVFEGPVGFAVNYGSSVKLTIHSFNITNAVINGEEVDYSLFEAPKKNVVIDLTPNADNWINGQNYRFETSGTDTYAKIERGVLKLKMNKGDLLWIPSLTVKDSTSAFTFENMVPGRDDPYIQIASHIKTGSNMYGSGIGSNNWKGYRWEWANSQVLNNIDFYYSNEDDDNRNGSSASAGSGSGQDAKWKKGEALSVRGTYTETVPVTYFYEGVTSLDEVANGDMYLKWYDYYGSPVGTSFGIICSGNPLEFTIDKITATNMNEAAAYSETFDDIDTTVPASIANEKISLTLDGTIGLNFAFNAGASLPADATVVATKNDEVVDTKAIVRGENLITVPVNAKEMTDVVTFSIMVGGEVFDGKTYTASVKEYAEKLMADDKYNDDWDALMTAMLKYGAAAQKLLNYKADEADVSGIDYDFSAYEPVTPESGDKSILKGLYMNLSLESDTVMKLYFMTADGVEPVVEINGKAVELVDNGDGYYVAAIDGIAADKLSEDVFVTVNGELSFYVNALDWANIASKDADANVATLAKALATYADAAAEIKN